MNLSQLEIKNFNCLADMLETSKPETAEIETSLAELAVLVRQDGYRSYSRVSKLIPVIADIFCTSPDPKVKGQCLRFIGNAVSYNEINQRALTDHSSFFKHGSKALWDSIQADNEENVNIYLAVLFNLCNESEYCQKFVVSHASLLELIFKAVDRYFSSDGFFLQYVCFLLDQLLSLDNTLQSLPIDCLNIFLRCCKQKLLIDNIIDEEEDDDDKRVAWSDHLVSLQTLLTLLEAPKYQVLILENEDKVADLFRICQVALAHSLTDVDLRRRILSVLGSIAAYDSFSDLIKISQTSSIYKTIQNLLYSLNSSTACASAALCVLGNIAVSSTRISEIIEQNPDIISTSISLLLETNDPFELQGAHFIKNCSIPASYRQAILECKVERLVSNLVNINIFPSIRRIGLQIARNLLSSWCHDSNQNNGYKFDRTYNLMVESLAKRYKVEDDSSLKIEIQSTYASIISSFSESNTINTLTSRLTNNKFIDLVGAILQGTEKYSSSSSSGQQPLQQPQPSTLVSPEANTTKVAIDEVSPIPEEQQMNQMHMSILRFTKSIGIIAENDALLKRFFDQTDLTTYGNLTNCLSIALLVGSAFSDGKDTTNQLKIGIMNNLVFTAVKIKEFLDNNRPGDPSLSRLCDEVINDCSPFLG
ncbi:hypothetical protein NADFUDRAFT_82524 [Nadsonia fulvescens var. elongata DSM 6958]|uniref:ARM repeat-containing protein n=1 Tax=Nadsonia fulvescens var. elongata DSM 6958 TaxID=857566 RepID=A0A1E3PPP8_9ASCO|nr:hypothetical protein NADFUDRAFT_82524 [Nadsonia fulvescens var. elongata DSM 6958]